MSYAIGTRAECDAIKATRDKLLGPPSKGFHMGTGRHVEMPEAWDGEGEVPPGWTGYAGPLEHPITKGEWGVDTGGEAITKALAVPELAAKLSEPEKVELAEKVATAVTLEAWWGFAEPVEEEPVDPKGEGAGLKAPSGSGK
jgi:hypothetical protein